MKLWRQAKAQRTTINIILPSPPPKSFGPGCDSCHLELQSVPKRLRKKGVTYRGLKWCIGCNRFFKRQ